MFCQAFLFTFFTFTTGIVHTYTMNFANYLLYLRQKSGLTKKALADMVGCTPSYIFNMENEINRPPDFALAQKMANYLTKDETEQKKFLELAYEGRLKTSDFAYQSVIRNKPLVETFKSSGLSAPESIDRSDESMILSLRSLHKHSILKAFQKRGGSMFRVKVDTQVSGFKQDDVLEVELDSHLQHGKLYLLRDGVTKSVVIHEVRFYGDMKILRDQDKETAFDPKRFHVIGRVINYTRNL